jgi:hypothetical protein
MRRRLVSLDVAILWLVLNDSCPVCPWRPGESILWQMMLLLNFKSHRCFLASLSPITKFLADEALPTSTISGTKEPKFPRLTYFRIFRATRLLRVSKHTFPFPSTFSLSLCSIHFTLSITILFF